jgi:molecular chaperone Hsp33
MDATPSSRPRAGDDLVLPFAVPALEVRGRTVRLGPLIDRILSSHAYPEVVSRLLGEAIALTVLLGSSLKFEGRFILQTQTEGPVHLMVVDFTTPEAVRAYAGFDADAVARAVAGGRTSPTELLGTGTLAMTIDQGADMSRYQGIVSLDGETLEEAAHRYFAQSEQIPTRVRLAVAQVFDRVPGGPLKAGWRAGGLLVQYLPETGGYRDLPPGDAPEGHEAADEDEDDQWVEARALVDTLADHELIDPDLSSEEVLFRLFHERGARAFEARALVAKCRCSRERLFSMLGQFTAEERADMVVEHDIIVTCEFCSTRYAFKASEFDPAA